MKESVVYIIPPKWFFMPLQLEKESNGTENLAFNSFWEFLL